MKSWISTTVGLPKYCKADFSFKSKLIVRLKKENNVKEQDSYQEHAIKFVQSVHYFTYNLNYTVLC